MRTSRPRFARTVASGPGRLRWAIAAILTFGLFSGGWAAARQFESPAQREAAARPPASGPLFVPIEDGMLSDRVSGSGNLTYEHLDPVSVNAGGVVTGQPLARDRAVRAGGVLTEIESHPVFVFAGRFPFYRDLARGDRGADVAQLQSGLRAAGHPIPQRETGTYGAGTAAAVKALYEAAGYPAPAGLPLADLSIARRLPAIVYAVPAIGDRLDDGAVLATLADGRLVVRVSLDAGAFSSVTTGQRADVTGRGIGSPLPGRVAALRPNLAHHDPQVTIALATPPQQDLAGRPVVATITIDAVPQRGLIVPSRAVADGPDGSSQLIVRRGTERVAVVVQVLGSLDGRSVIRPTDPAAARALNAGDLVQVG